MDAATGFRDQLKRKIRLIFVPYLIMAIGFMIIYSLLNWLLIIKNEVILLKENTVHFWIPLGLSFLLVLVGLRPKINLLKLKTKRSNLPGLYMFVATLALYFPTMLAQQFTQSVTGKLTELQTVDEIDKHQATKFYSIKNYYFNKAHAVHKYTYELTGRRGKNLDLNLYITCPFELKGMPLAPPLEEMIAAPIAPATIHKIQSHKENPKRLFFLDGVRIDSLKWAGFPKDSIALLNNMTVAAATAVYGEDGINGAFFITSKRQAETKIATLQQSAPKAWLGLHYHKQISNRVNDNEKTKQQNQFYHESRQAFSDSNLTAFTYFERPGYTDTRDGYIAAMKQSGYPDSLTGTAAILEPRYGRFSKRYNGHLLWTTVILFAGAAVFFVMLLIPGLKEQPNDS